MSTRLRNFMAASRRPNMHAFGLFPASQDLSWIEAHGLEISLGTVTGTVDGTNATFTIPERPVNVDVYVNGLRMNRTAGVDYTFTPLTGTIVFAANSIPAYGALIEVELIGD